MSAPEDNPADDVQPTKEEWDAAMNMPSLVLSRRVNERAFIDVGGKRIIITVTQIDGRKQVRLAFNAPPEVLIWREEVAPKEPDDAL